MRFVRNVKGGHIQYQALYCAAVALFAIALVGCSGSDGVGDTKVGKQKSTTGGGDKSTQMSRQEFRDKLKTLPAVGLGWKNWDGQNRRESENVGCPLLVSDLKAAFGEPSKTMTLGRTINWYWQCKDGRLRVEASQEWSNKGLYGTDGKTIKHKPGKYLCVLGVHDG